MQRKVLASAVALGLSASLITVPSVNAAEIGKKGEGGVPSICSLRLTDAEEAYRDKVAGDASVGTLLRDTVSAIEAVYPQVKAPGDAFLQNPTVKAYVEAHAGGREPTEELEDAFTEVLEKELDRFRNDPELGLVYEETLSFRMSLANLSVGGAEDVKMLELKQIVASDDPYQSSNVFDVLDDEDTPIPASKVAALKRAYEKTPSGQTQRVFQRDFGSAMTAAEKACAAGGDRSVAFPTKAVNPKPNPTTKPKPDTAKPDQSKPGDKTNDQPGDSVTDKAKDNAKDNGSSEDTGKIIGIIAGVLVALGLVIGGVVAFAPQLGITLPF